MAYLVDPAAAAAKTARIFLGIALDKMLFLTE
jgi:hypothetical protein